jgi:hypothetical protein
VHEALLAKSRTRPDQLYRMGRALAAWARESRSPSLEALALSAAVGPRAASALLSVIADAGLVRWKDSALEIDASAETIEAQVRALAGRFETLRTQDARRLDALAAYAYGIECRAVALRRYFGEDEGAACGICDVCRGETERAEGFWAPLEPPPPPGRYGHSRGRRGRRARRRRGAPAQRRDRRGAGGPASQVQQGSPRECETHLGRVFNTASTVRASPGMPRALAASAPR